MQALHRLVILQVKCTIRIQALLYLSHPPETGSGGKRSFNKGLDEEEENVFWYLAFLSSQCVKAKTINSHSAGLKGFFSRLRFRIFVVF